MKAPINSSFKKYFSTILLFTMCIACTEKESSQGENFTQNVNQVAANIVDDSELLSFFDQPRNPITPAFEMLPTGSIRPEGWLKKIMEQDLEKGIVGALDDLNPQSFSDDLFRTTRRAGMSDIPDMGDLVLTGEDWEKSIMWWNSETNGNWWEGFVRHAFLTDNQQAIAQANRIVGNLLASQGEDGYIGIYKPSLRYQHEGSNGELWAQTTAFRTMLAYYEFTQKQEVLEAVEKAMALTMEKYGEQGRNPFLLKNAFGGVTHGLMLTDVCETLFRLTGNQAYEDYATYLYRAFSSFSINRAFNDLRYPFLMEKDTLFSGHAVHTYEHFRTLAQAYYATGYPEMKTAFENSLRKLDFCLLPSGAGHGNEWIAEMVAEPTETASEFCTMLELRNSYGSMLQKTGDLKFAEEAEKLTFNGIMGFRNEDGTAITYGKGDNCYVLDGKHIGEDSPDPRYKYSPTHSDPAVCCVPNYTRNFPYFLDNMWMKKGNGFAALLYGPASFSTEVDGEKFTIKTKTNYPFSDQVKYEVETDAALDIPLYFRKPSWAKSMDLVAAGAKVQDEGEFFKVQKAWETGDEIELSFAAELETKTFRNGEKYLQRGALVFAYEIASFKKEIKSYGMKGFSDYYCFPEDEKYKQLSFAKAMDVEFVSNPTKNNPWEERSVYVKGNLENQESGKMEEVMLVPMGQTILRRVTFPQIR